MLITTYMYPTQNTVCMYVHHVLLCIKDLHIAVFCHTLRHLVAHDVQLWPTLCTYSECGKIGI